MKEQKPKKHNIKLYICLTIALVVILWVALFYLFRALRTQQYLYYIAPDEVYRAENIGCYDVFNNI